MSGRECNEAVIKMKHSRRPALKVFVPLAFAAVWLVATAADAQESRYQQWQDPSQPDRAQQLIDKLTPLIDEAERRRAADPRFLSDLRSMIREFDRPLQTSLWRDDFSDGDFTNNPAWRVAAGRFWIESNFGLRSVVTEAPPATTESQQQRKLTREEKAKLLFGAILGQALKNGQDQSGGAATTSSAADIAAIEAPVTISNAFTARIELSSWVSPGQAEFSALQSTGAGYSLVYVPGAQPVLALHRVSASGRSVIDSIAVAALEDRKLHRLEWTRGLDGTMTVSLDDQQKLSASDRTYLGSFAGFQIVNRGGDYILRSVEILGTQ